MMVILCLNVGAKCESSVFPLTLTLARAEFDLIQDAVDDRKVCQCEHVTAGGFGGHSVKLSGIIGPDSYGKHYDTKALCTERMFIRNNSLCVSLSLQIHFIIRF